MAVKKCENGYEARGCYYVYGVRKDYRRRGFKTKSDALKWELKYRDTHLLELSDIRSIELSQLFIMYQKNIKGKIKTSTYITNEKTFKKITDELNNIDPRKFDKRQAQKYIDETYHKYSKAYADKIYITLKKALTFGVKNGIIEHNVLNNVDKVRNRDEIEKPLDNFWTEDEFKQFIKYVKPKYQDVFTFMFYTGLRKGELQGLQWEDVNFDNNSIQIIKQYSNMVKTLTSPKTNNSKRVLYLPNFLMAILRQNKARSEEFIGFNDKWYCFGLNEPIKAKTLSNNLTQGIQKSGVKKITIHGLRHSCASLLIQKGMLPSSVAEYIGDTIEQVLKTYTHTYESEKKKIANVLEKTS